MSRTYVRLVTRRGFSDERLIYLRGPRGYLVDIHSSRRSALPPSEEQIWGYATTATGPQVFLDLRDAQIWQARASSS